MTSTSYSLTTIAEQMEIPVTFILREIANSKVIAFGSGYEKRISGTELERWQTTRQFEIMLAHKKLMARKIEDTQLKLELESISQIDQR